MRQYKKLIIILFVIILIVSLMPDIFMVYSIRIRHNGQLALNQYLKYNIFLSIISLVSLASGIAIWFYNKSLRRRLILSNKSLTSIYRELKGSEEKLKSQLVILENNERKIKRSEERYSFVINTLKVGIWDYDAVTGATYIAPQLYKMFCFEAKDFDNFSKTWYHRIHPKDRLGTLRFFRERLKNKDENFEYQFRHITAYGQYRWVQAVATAQWGSDGKLLRLAGSFTDIDEKKENEEKVKHMAYYDALTGLPNRAYLHEYVNSVIARGRMAAFIFIDIDNFKYVNDSLGHNLGDTVIIEMSNRISGLIADGIIARWGGDEMIVLLENVKSKEDVCKFVGEMIDKVYLSFCSTGITVNLSISAGIAIFPDHGNDFETLLKNADTAMYSAKDSGKNKYCLFDVKMNDAIYQKMKYEGLLRDAIENDGLELYFQPQYNMSDGTLCGVEALLRWKNEEYGNVSPAEFIPVAESSGLIIPLGLWVFKQACQFKLRLREKGFTNITVAINISALQFKQEDFIYKIKSYIEENGIIPHMLEFEITESILVDNTNATIAKLNELRNIGIKIALDDFGTGYSSLTYLKLLPIDTLKMDRSFIENVTVNKVDQDISGLFINIAHSLGLKVVAEGIETPEQRNLLRNFGCDIAQGFLYSEPIKDIDLFKLLEEQNKE